MIPKTIHYCWFGKKTLSEKAQKCINSWKKYCPEYEIKCWNEDNFDINYNDYTKAAYYAKKWAYVSDVARLKILYEHGGIYLDTDVELIKPLDELLYNRAYMGSESTGSVNSGLGCGAEKGFHVIKSLLDDYVNMEFDKNNLISCPVIITNNLSTKGYNNSTEIQCIEGMTIYPKEYFAPIDLTTGKKRITENTFSIHHYEASWKSEYEQKKTKIRKRLCKYLGNKIGLRLYGHWEAISSEGIVGYVKRHCEICVEKVTHE